VRDDAAPPRGPRDGRGSILQNEVATDIVGSILIGVICFVYAGLPRAARSATAPKRAVVSALVIVSALPARCSPTASCSSS
jgi:hypothetical protein